MESTGISARSDAPDKKQGQASLVEIRWHGRGGQGVVTAGELLAHAALIEGMGFQSFPEFSAERSGAPVTAYTRISPSAIDIQSAVVEPDIVVILDPTLLGVVDVFAGLKAETGVAVVNSTLIPEDLRIVGPLGGDTVCTVDATGISRELLERNLPNIAMLGALIKATGLVSLETMERCIEERLSARLSPSEVAANKTALKRGYDQVRIASLRQEITGFEEPDSNNSPLAASDGWRELLIGGYVAEAGNSIKTQTGAWRSNVPKLDFEKCTHCMLCWLFCPDDSVMVEDLQVTGFDLAHCKGCGICAQECPRDAIKMEEESSAANS